MAEIRPFAALRYDTAVAGEPSTLIAPPYDIVSESDRIAVHGRGPFNISLVDYGDEEPGDDASDNKYTRAREDLAAWQGLGVLKRDPEPRLYVYDQEFELEGKKHRRRSVFGRLRLEEWNRGVILPHEQTRARDKADRYQLLEATRVHLSPIMALYRNEAASKAVAEADLEPPLFDAVLPSARHTLSPLAPSAAARFQEAFARQRLYIADGHHRYEVALAYRNERRDKASYWRGDEPENFVLAALLDATDPEVVILPTHRLLKLSRPLNVAALEGLFEIDAVNNDREGGEWLRQAMSVINNRNFFGAVGLEAGKLHLVTVKDRAEVDALLPADRAAPWRALDVAVLHYALLPALGFEETPENVGFTDDREQALAEVEAGEWDAAFLLNPTRVEEVIAVAEAGERMPQKSTFFYPKLATGIVMLPLA